jgi:hypothetical protein
MAQRCATGDASISGHGVGEEVGEVRLELSGIGDGGDELRVVVDERDAKVVNGADELLEIAGIGFEPGGVPRNLAWISSSSAPPGLTGRSAAISATCLTRLPRPSGCLVIAGALTASLAGFDTASS